MPPLGAFAGVGLLVVEEHPNVKASGEVRINDAERLRLTATVDDVYAKRGQRDTRGPGEGFEEPPEEPLLGGAFADHG